MYHAAEGINFIFYTALNKRVMEGILSGAFVGAVLGGARQLIGDYLQQSREDRKDATGMADYPHLQKMDPMEDLFLVIFEEAELQRPVRPGSYEELSIAASQMNRVVGLWSEIQDGTARNPALAHALAKKNTSAAILALRRSVSSLIPEARNVSSLSHARTEIEKNISQCLKVIHSLSLVKHDDTKS